MSWVRFVAAMPWLVAGGVCREVGFAIYGRRFQAPGRVS